MIEARVDNVVKKCRKIFLILLFVTTSLFIIFNYVKNNTDILDINVSILKNENIKLEEEVLINFSSIVSIESVEESLDISPAESLSLKWLEGGKKLHIAPNKYWKNDTKYTLRIKGRRGILGTSFDRHLHFYTEDYPRITSISPSKGEKNVLIDIEDPIVVNFDKSLKDFNVKFVIDPKGEFVSQISKTGTSINILSKSGLQKGEKYNIEVYVKPVGSSIEYYQKIFESDFETKPEELKNWDKNLEIRLIQAKKYTNAKILEGKYIDVNLKSQIMAIIENGEIVDTYLISSGKNGMNTPEGSFKIENKALKPWSKKYNLFMPYWMAITSSGEYGIHELPEWPGGYKEGANHLGIPVSHGCVRLGVGSAERVYNWAEIGTPVIIHQ